MVIFAPSGRQAGGHRVRQGSRAVLSLPARLEHERGKVRTDLRQMLPLEIAATLCYYILSAVLAASFLGRTVPGSDI